MGTIEEDIEAHYIQANNLQSRGKSYNPRSNVPTKLLRTLDDNVNAAPSFQRAQQDRSYLAFSDEMEERQRIFEDEIIKRIKVIQSFIKNLDAKFNKFRGSTGSLKNKQYAGEDKPERLQPENRQKQPAGKIS